MPTLHWIGKDKVINHHMDVPFKVLEHSYGFDEGKKIDKETQSGNKIIHGDNLEALKSLLPEYEGKNKFSPTSQIKQLPMSGEALDRYKNPDNDPRGPWKSDPATAQSGHATQSQFYTLTAPNGQKHDLQSGRCWTYNEDVMDEAITDNRIWFGKDGNGVPRIKTYLHSKERGLVPETLWFAADVGTNESAKVDLKSVFKGNAIFQTPKPVNLIERIIQLSTNDDSIVLDSFSGSAATAHAVLNINKQDGGSRKFICIEMEDYAETITAERVKRVIKGYVEDKKSVEGTGDSFDFYKLGEPLFNEEGNLNESVGLPKIRNYVWYTETKSPLVEETHQDNTHFLGKHLDTGYYFNYEAEAVTTLDHTFLASMKTKAEQYVIYADNCLLTKAFMVKHHIIFKKIPRDITRF